MPYELNLNKLLVYVYRFGKRRGDLQDFKRAGRGINDNHAKIILKLIKTDKHRNR